MFKVMVFMKRKEGISREQFIEYYEKYHQKLARKILPPMPDYRRNYPVYDDPLNYSGGFEGKEKTSPMAGGNGMAGDEYDVIMTISFQERADYEKLLTTLRSPEIAEQMAADEDKFMEREGNRRVLVVEEYRSPPIGTLNVDYS